MEGLTGGLLVEPGVDSGMKSQGLHSGGTTPSFFVVAIDAIMASHVDLAEVYKGYSSLVLQATAWHSDGYSRLMEATLKLGVL